MDEREEMAAKARTVHAQARSEAKEICTKISTSFKVDSPLRT